MLQKLKAHWCKISFFVLNAMAMFVVTFLIKNEHDQQKSAEQQALQDQQVVPLDQAVRSAQELIAADREAALRDLNTQPKEELTEQVVTEETKTTAPPTTETVSKPAAAAPTKTTPPKTETKKKADTKTKSS